MGQYHGTFRSPYSGQLSLQNDKERDVSLTTTLFFGLRPTPNTQLYFNLEIAGGRGFSGVSGIANSSNGELPRVASATPKPYLARLYISHDIGFGTETESFESEVNQLAGPRRTATPSPRAASRAPISFDNNRYSHDPRTQFLGWGVMFNGAWDYPADVRGYTWAGFMNCTSRTGPSVTPAPPCRLSPTACASIIVSSAIAGTFMKGNTASKLVSMRGPSVCCTIAIAPMRGPMPRPFSKPVHRSHRQSSVPTGMERSSTASASTRSRSLRRTSASSAAWVRTTVRRRASPSPQLTAWRLLASLSLASAGTGPTTRQPPKLYSAASLACTPFIWRGAGTISSLAMAA